MITAELVMIGLAAIILLAVEIFVQRSNRSLVRKTRVSNLTESNYQSDIKIPIAQPLSFVLVFAGLVAGFVLQAIWGFNTFLVIAPVTAGLLYTGIRLFNLTARTFSARSSMPDRIFRIRANPKVKNARFAFYFSAPDAETPTHVKTWQAELDKINQPYVIILREQKHLAGFETNSRPVVIHIPTREPLSLSDFPKIEAVLYGNNGQKNRAMISANHHLTHVQLLHGDSDKPPSYSPLSKQYDLLFVAGQMAIDRYDVHGVHIPAARFKIVGRPQVSKILAPEPGSDKNTVLYMPTWRGLFEDTQFSSLDRAAEIIDKVLSSSQGKTLIFKPHPLSFKEPEWPELKQKIKAALTIARANGSTGVFCDENEDPFDLYNRADILISDISSVMIDFLYSGKPMLVIKPQNASEDGLKTYASLKASYQVEASLDNLDQMLALAMSGDPMKDGRLAVRDYAFGDIGHPPGELFRKAVLDILDETSENRRHDGRA